MIVAPLAAMLIQFAISRAREFEADRGGAQISGDPQALASALEKIHRYAQGIPMATAEAHPATAQMMIMNPLVRRRRGGPLQHAPRYRRADRAPACDGRRGERILTLQPRVTRRRSPPVLDIQLCAAAVLGDTLAGGNLSTGVRGRVPPARRAEPGRTRRQCGRSATRACAPSGCSRRNSAKLLLTPVRHAGLRSLLLVGLAQLQFTRAKPYAIVDHAVQAAERLGQPAARGLVNAVLRNFLRRRHDLAAMRWHTPEVRLGFPAWWVQKLRDQYPEGWEAVLATENRHPPMTLRVNRRRTTVDSLPGAAVAGGASRRGASGTWRCASTRARWPRSRGSPRAW